MAQTPNGAGSDSDDEVFTNSGLQRALNATIRLPSAEHVPTKKEMKDERYRVYISDSHDHLQEKVDKARDILEANAKERDKNDNELFPVNAAQLNVVFLEANSRLIKAEREYHAFTAGVNELRNIDTMTRDEAQLWHGRKLLEKQERDDEHARPAQWVSPNKKAFRKMQQKLKNAEELHRSADKAYDLTYQELEGERRNVTSLQGQLAQSELDVTRSQ